MNVLSQLKLLPTLLMNNNSSVFLASDSVILTAFTSDNILTRIIRAIAQILYFISKWMMYMIDVIYFYILQLAGVGVDVSIVDSARTDMTFSLLLDNKDQVTQIIRNFIVIAIILIIVTAIIAIIKQQANSLKDKKAKNNPTGEVMRGVVKAVVLLFVTPLIAICSIVASSVLLQSLFNATNLSDTKSLSARIFNVSASAANKYKIYADNGVRIPIKYKFSGETKDKAIHYAVEMIGEENFPSMYYFNVNETFLNSTFKDPVLGEDINRGSHKSGTDAWLNDVYYKYFDSSDDYRYSTDPLSIDTHRIMQTHRNEYYAMSDVIAYALDTMEPFYFITIQELLESLVLINADDVLEHILESYNVRIIDSNGDTVGMSPTEVTNIDAIKNALNGTAQYRFITYTSTYDGEQYTYTHIKDSEDEMEGAKFIIAYQKESDIAATSLNIDGDYYTNSSTSTPTKRQNTQFYFKESDYARYKEIDIFYYYNTDREDFVKAPTLNNGSDAIDYDTYKAGGYYYKIGSDYIEINSTNFAKISYIDKDGNHKSLGGAKFYTKEIQTYYLPLLGGIALGNYKAFTSQYISNGNIITARGIFDDASYPTAIRRTASGDIMFYRDDLELVSEGSVSDFGTMDQIEAESDPEETDENQNIFQQIGSTMKRGWGRIKSFFKELFNPLKLVPDLNINPSAMSTTYTKKTTSVYVLNDSRLHISYFYSDDFTAQLSKKLHGININYLFDVMQINPVTLIVGATIFMKIMVTAVFGLVNRAFNLLILFLIYPVACASMPLDDTSGATKSGAYAKWTERYLRILFSTYGLILGINFAFLVMPVIDEITFFTPQNLQENRYLGRIAEALSNPLLLINIGGEIFKPNFNVSCVYLNKLLRLIFQIAAFSLVTSANGKGETYYEVIKNVVGLGPGVLEDNPADAVKKTLKTMTKVVNMTFNPSATVKNAIEKGKDLAVDAFGALPGSAVLKEGVTRGAQFYEQRKKDESRKALIKALENKEPKESVEAKLKEYQTLHKSEKSK